MPCAGIRATVNFKDSTNDAYCYSDKLAIEVIILLFNAFKFSIAVFLSELVRYVFIFYIKLS